MLHCMKTNKMREKTSKGVKRGCGGGGVGFCSQLRDVRTEVKKVYQFDERIAVKFFKLSDLRKFIVTRFLGFAVMVGVVKGQHDLVREVLVARLAPDPVVSNLLFVSLKLFKNHFFELTFLVRLL